MPKLIGSCCLAATLMFSLNTFAQSPQSQTYGTQGEIAYVIPATVLTQRIPISLSSRTAATQQGLFGSSPRAFTTNCRSAPI